MSPAIWFLVVRSLRGRLVRALRLARRPKYLLGVLLTVGWMALWLLPWLKGGARDRDLASLMDSLPGLQPALQTLVGLLFALLVTLWWLWPFGKPNIGLKENELQLLLSSPLPRRDVIRFAMLKSQPPILFGCVIMTVFFRAPSWESSVQHFTGLWLVFTVWDLHSKGKRLWLGRQRELPRNAAAARWFGLLGLMAAFWLTVGWGLLQVDFAVFASVAGVDGFLEVASGQARRFGATAGGWALAPFGWLAAPLLHNFSALSAGSRLLSFAGPLLLLAVHQRWVARSQARFEEATLEAARRNAREVEGLAKHTRKSKRERARTPFQLSPGGRAEVAVFWKNLVLIRRTPLRLQAAVGLGVALGTALLCLAPPVPDWALAIPAMAGMVLLAIIPALAVGGFRNDFRADLKHVEALRPWPLVGWRLMAAEVLSPAAVGAMTAATGAAILVAFDVATFRRPPLGAPMEFWEGLADSMGTARPLTSIVLVLTIAPLSLAMGIFASSLQNLAALAFPGWVPLGANRKEIAQQMGSNLLLTLVQMLGMLLALVPGALAVAAVVLGQTALLGWPIQAWQLPLLSLLAAATPLGLSAGAIALGGRLWERLDPSRELLEE